ASGALAGAQLGSVVPGIGNVAGAIGGGLIGLVGGLGF
ncbi:DNA transfer protein, partial [Escherichia coli]|nr:DNA transfer protein [Escherichia coli]EHT4645073.1 DNA transfer protein [Escherichia coli]EHT4645202.1 DNA transfer protein [Escherichia coli]